MGAAPRAVLGDQVRALLAVERAIESGLASQSSRAGHPGLDASLAAVQSRCAARAEELERYLCDNDLDRTVKPSPIAALLAGVRSTDSMVRRVCTYSTACSFAATGYGVLVQLSLRLYDPELRELAPRHLRSHAQAVRLLNHLLPEVVVQELDRHELDCRCICPMCGLGVCGCTVAGRDWIGEAWREAGPEVDDRPGFVITTPRRGTQLAGRGVRSGDRLVAIDGQPIRTSGIAALREVQTAIRRHELGDELQVTIAHGGGPPRDLHIRHVSDYPPSE